MIPIKELYVLGVHAPIFKTEIGKQLNFSISLFEFFIIYRESNKKERQFFLLC